MKEAGSKNIHVTPHDISPSNTKRQYFIDKYGVKRDLHGFSRMEKAVCFGRVDFVQDSLNKDPNIIPKEELAHPPYGKTKTALYLAAQNGNVPMASLLLDNGANPSFINHQLLTPLSAAVINGRSDVAKLMISKPNISQFDPKCLSLSHAFQANQTYIAFLLYQKGFRLFSDNDNACLEFKLCSVLESLGHSIKNNKMKKHLSLYGHFDERTNHYSHHVTRSALYSALDIAVIKGEMQEIQDLLSKPHEINRPGFLGLTPLHWAVLKGDVAIIELLLNHQANPDIQSQHYLTPLHLSVLHEKSDVFKLIAKVSSNLNPQTTLRKFTPLHLAIMQENGIVIKAMRNDPRVDFHAKAKDDITPEALADQYGIVLEMPTDIKSSNVTSTLSSKSHPLESIKSAKPSLALNDITDLLADLKLDYERYQYEVHYDPYQKESQTFLISQAAKGGYQLQAQTVNLPQNVGKQQKKLK